MKTGWPVSPGEIKSEFERRRELAKKGIVCDTLTIGEFIGGDKIDIRDSVVYKSSIGRDRKPQT
ncbi:MAG: hypothetical protein AB1779_01790 [Candidatus Thermoplasmatota archaeon]